MKIKIIRLISIGIMLMLISLLGVRAFADGEISVKIKISEGSGNSDQITYISGGSEAIINVNSEYGIVGGVIRISKDGNVNENQYSYSGEDQSITEAVSIGNDGDGEYMIECEFYDSENHSESKTKNVVCDSNGPVIEDIITEGGISLLGNQATDIEFTEGLTVIFVSYDSGMGVDRIEYKLNENGNIAQEGALDVINEGDGRYKATLGISSGFNGVISARAFDKVNNDSGDITTCVINTSGKENANDSINTDEEKHDDGNDEEQNVTSDNEENNKRKKEMPETKSEGEKEDITDETNKMQNKKDINKNTDGSNEKNNKKNSGNEKDKNIKENSKDNKTKNQKEKSDGKNKSIKQKETEAKKATSIKIKGIKNGEIYNSSVSFTAQIKGIEIRKQDIVIEITHNDKKQFMKNLKNENGEWLCQIDKQYLEISDGKYELTVTVFDDITHRKIKKANRYFYVNTGSIYVCDESCNKYLGGYASSPFSFGITEINIDDELEKSVKITLAKNGVSSTLIRDRDYIIDKSKIDDKTHYHYSVNENVFSEDGIYTLLLSSVDNAGNNNVSYDGEKGVDINLGIDNIAPMVETLNLKSGMNISSDKHLVKAVIHDNLSIKDIIINVNGKACKYNKDGDNYEFWLSEEDSFQNVNIFAVDEAGHTTNLEYNDITVSTKLLIRIFHFLVLGLGYFMVLIGSVGLIINKRKICE